MSPHLLPRWAGLGLLLALAACEPPAEVHFAQPFPAGVPDLPGFAPADQGRYVAVDDTSRALVLGEKVLVGQTFFSQQVTARQLDSLGLPARPGPATTAAGQHYWVQLLAPGRFGLRQEQLDTLLRLGPGTHLRRFKDWYYANTPDGGGPAQPAGAAWTVQRLAVANGHLLRQHFNPDTLRIQALAPATVQHRRENGRLVFTLTPPNQRAIRQVSSFAGLWLAEGDYVKQ